MKYLRIVFVFLSLVLASCNAEQADDSGSFDSTPTRPVVVASNYPLYYFASRIAGDSVEVILPEIKGDPANWKPESHAIEQLQSADLVFLVGAGYESWLEWVSLPDEKLMDTSASFRDRLIPLEQEGVHQHGPQGEHSHTGFAFTVWLDPGLAIEQAKAIAQALSKLSPGDSAAYETRLASLEGELLSLDKNLRQVFEGIGDQPVLFSHPVYQYLETRYSLNGLSVHWEPDEEPGKSAMIEFHRNLRGHPAKLMIWEDQPLQTTADQLEGSGVASIVFHTASSRPQSGDYFSLMEANIQRLSSR